MSNRIAAAFGAAALTVGILVGAAGAVLVGATSTADRSGMDGAMEQMMTMMGGGSMMGATETAEMAAMHARHHGLDR